MLKLGWGGPESQCASPLCICTSPAYMSGGFEEYDCFFFDDIMTSGSIFVVSWSS